jgi:hypothetical protein
MKNKSTYKIDFFNPDLQSYTGHIGSFDECELETEDEVKEWLAVTEFENKTRKHKIYHRKLYSNYF